MNNLFLKIKKMKKNYKIKKDLLWRKKFLLMLHKLNKLGLQLQITEMLTLRI